MRQRECLIVALISIPISVLMIGCPGSTNGGSGSALRVSFAVAAKSPEGRTLPANNEVFDPGTESTAPARPTTGTRKEAAAVAVATPPAFGIFHVLLTRPAHSMASLKAISVRHRTPTPLSATATSSKLSTTRSKSQKSRMVLGRSRSNGIYLYLCRFVFLISGKKICRERWGAALLCIKLTPSKLLEC